MKNVNRRVKKGGHLCISIINTGKSEITSKQFSIIYTRMVDWRKNTFDRDYADIWWILTDFHSHAIITAKFEYLMIIFKTLTIINKHCYLTNQGWVRRSGPLMLSCIFMTCYCKCFTMSHHYNNESTLSEHFFVFATCANSFLKTISRILSFSKRHTPNQIVFLKTSLSRKKKIYFRARKFRRYKAFDGR